MRNQALPGIKKLIDGSPMKQRDNGHTPPVPKPEKKEVIKKKDPPPPKKGPTTYIPKKEGGYTALTEPN